MNRYYVAKNLGDTSGFNTLAINADEALELFAETRGWESYDEMSQSKGDLWLAFVS